MCSLQIKCRFIFELPGRPLSCTKPQVVAIEREAVATNFKHENRIGFRDSCNTVGQSIRVINYRIQFTYSSVCHYWL